MITSLIILLNFCFFILFIALLVSYGNFREAMGKGKVLKEYKELIGSCSEALKLAVDKIEILQKDFDRLRKKNIYYENLLKENKIKFYDSD